VQAAQCERQLVAIGDPQVLSQRAALLGLPLTVQAFDAQQSPRPNAAGEIFVSPLAVQAPVQAGRLNASNGQYVLQTLDRAIQLCQSGAIDAMVTAPIHKGVINDAGVAFSGHTEYLAQATDTEQVVMMLATEGLRVALATTHIPLAKVPTALNREDLSRVLRIVQRDMQRDFALAAPRILVCGLNPHAGEGGHMGREEIDVITPVIESLKAEGMSISGPYPADTVFTPKHMAQADVIVAMYHDQGLPVLKYMGFGAAVNITLGLPIIRTSVDHGTALDLAGSEDVDTGSMTVAIDVAEQMARGRRSEVRT
jgi:4-hydroxythreonine-4-phosphate dehydrogenase